MESDEYESIKIARQIIEPLVTEMNRLKFEVSRLTEEVRSLSNLRPVDNEPAEPGYRLAGPDEDPVGA